MSDDERSRYVGVCQGCGSAFAVMETEAGDLVPMGSRTGCPCGCTAFTRLDADDAPGAG